MKTAGYIGNLLPDGHLSVTSEIVRELGLQPNDRVQVVLIPLPAAESNSERRAIDRAGIWRQVDTLRATFSDRNFNLTDALLLAREEEDAAS